MPTDRSDLIAGETLVTLIALARNFKSPRTGNTLHIASVRRWVRKGIAGVRLGTVHVGGTVYTSWEEFGRWRRAVSGARVRTSPPVKGGRTAAARERAMLRAKAANDRHSQRSRMRPATK